MEARTGQSMVPTWSQILRAGSALKEAPDSETAQQYVELVRESEGAPPYHLRPILRHLEAIEASSGKHRSEISVLDHGCGGGATLIYLAARGYRHLHGVDVGGNLQEADEALRAITGQTEPHLFLYDGSSLPFTESQFDFIFSQQVIEHVNDDCIEAYLDDEVRVLCDSGVVYHQIPHRWTPWESHTKTWAVHYLPQSVRLGVYRLLGHDPAYIASILFLRSPLYYGRQLRARYPSVSNETLARLKLRPDHENYEGNIKLRRLVSAGAQLPLLRMLLANFVMLDMTARKSSGAHGAGRELYKTP